MLNNECRSIALRTFVPLRLCDEIGFTAKTQGHEVAQGIDSTLLTSIFDIHFVFCYMNLEAFTKTLSDASPPASFSACLAALWYDAKGDWNRAHEQVDDLDGKQAAWVHAYLHRKEGDVGNAGYWYRRAGKEPAKVSLKEEWEELVRNIEC
jgi:hypothetical protein